MSALVCSRGREGRGGVRGEREGCQECEDGDRRSVSRERGMEGKEREREGGEGGRVRMRTQGDSE